MKSDFEKKIIAIAITLLIVSVIGWNVYKIVMGRNGVVRKVGSVEIEYDSVEVLEKLSVMVKEKYLAVYNETKESSDKKLDDLYNVDVAISNLVENGVLEYYYYTNYDENSKQYTYLTNEENTAEIQKRTDLYWINSSKIEGVEYIGKGKKYTDNNEVNKNDVFVLEKNTENSFINYCVKYYDSTGKEKEIGNIDIEKPFK